MTARLLITNIVELSSRGAVVIGVLQEGTLRIGMVSEAVPLPEGPAPLILRAIDYVDDGATKRLESVKLGVRFLGSPSAAALRTALAGRSELAFHTPGRP